MYTLYIHIYTPLSLESVRPKPFPSDRKRAVYLCTFINVFVVVVVVQMRSCPHWPRRAVQKPRVHFRLLRQSQSEKVHHGCCGSRVKAHVPYVSIFTICETNDHLSIV